MQEREDEKHRPRARRGADDVVDPGRRRLVASGTLAALGILAGPMLNLGRSRLSAAAPEVEISHRAIDLVRESPVVDMLGLFTLDWGRLFGWYRRPETFSEADFRELEASGVDIFHPAVETGGQDPRESARAWLAGWNRLLASHACFLSRVDSINDLLVLPRVGKIGVVLGFQNSDHFHSRRDVEVFRRLGQRISQLTYNSRNPLGSGCYESTDRGLTELGIGVVEEMNRVGMAVDVSHCGDRTTREAIRASKRPVLISHSNCRALVPGHPRCKPDDLIRELARSGGVMGITLVRAFVSWKRSPDLGDVLDHFDHVARLVGTDHVGLGSDIDVTARDPRTGSPNPVYRIAGIRPELRVFQIVDGLLGRGWGADGVRAVLGGNALRVLAEAWPDESWTILPERTFRRDPFCPPPLPEGPRRALASGDPAEVSSAGASLPARR